MDEFFVRNRLSAYIDGELPAAEAREVETALTHNAALRAEYEGLRAAVQLLREHGPMSAPAGFDIRLSERLAREPMPVGWRVWARKVRPELVLLGAVAAAAILYVGAPSNSPDAPVAAVVAPAEVAAAKGPAEGGGDATGDAPDVAVEGGFGGGKADGVLGDEGFAAARRDAEQKLAAGPPPGAVVGPGSPGGLTAGTPGGGSSGGGATSYNGTRLGPASSVQRDPYMAPYESDADVTIAGSKVYVKPGGAADGKAAPAPASAPLAATVSLGATVYSPPPYRYRVRSGNETMLKDLYAVAASLGGHLADADGRAVAIHMLESGEVKTVRVVVPSGKVDELTARMRALGDLETMAAGHDTLYAPGADVPVEVELERE